MNIGSYKLMEDPEYLKTFADGKKSVGEYFPLIATASLPDDRVKLLCELAIKIADPWCERRTLLVKDYDDVPRLDAILQLFTPNIVFAPMEDVNLNNSERRAIRLVITGRIAYWVGRGTERAQAIASSANSVEKVSGMEEVLPSAVSGESAAESQRTVREERHDPIPKQSCASANTLVAEPSELGLSADESDVSIARKRTSKERSDLILAFKQKASAAGIRVTDLMIARAANPTWHDRTPVSRWKSADLRSTAGDNGKIRKILTAEPHRLKEMIETRASAGVGQILPVRTSI